MASLTCSSSAHSSASGSPQPTPLRQASSAHFVMTISSLVTTNAKCCFPNIGPQTTMFCSKKKPVPFVIITVITTRISLHPPCHIEDCAAGVIADIKRGELRSRQTAEDLKTKEFLRLTLTPQSEREGVSILCFQMLSRAEQITV